MKKTMGISLAAILMAMPLVAHAEIPVYPLATPSANDGTIAGTGYVKGAYNSAMNIVNTIPRAVYSTVNNAKVNGEIPVDLSGVTVSGTADINLEDASVTGDITNTVTQGSVTMDIPKKMTGTVGTITSWERDALDGTAPVAVETSEKESVTVGVSGTEVTSTFASAGIAGVNVGTMNLSLNGSGVARASNLPVSVDDYYLTYEPVIEPEAESSNETESGESPETGE